MKQALAFVLLVAAFFGLGGVIAFWPEAALGGVFIFILVACVFVLWGLAGELVRGDFWS